MIVRSMTLFNSIHITAFCGADMTLVLTCDLDILYSIVYFLKEISATFK